MWFEVQPQSDDSHMLLVHIQARPTMPCIHLLIECKPCICVVNCLEWKHTVEAIMHQFDTNCTHYPIYWYIGNTKFTIIDMQSCNIVPVLHWNSWLNSWNTIYQHLLASLGEVPAFCTYFDVQIGHGQMVLLLYLICYVSSELGEQTGNFHGCNILQKCCFCFRSNFRIFICV